MDERRHRTREAEATAGRDQQLRRFAQSPMQAQPATEHVARAIRFEWASMFHAACAACDCDEMLALLRADDAASDIDCLNMEGLSALHQAAIDNNLEMVQFLIKLNADINVEDRESWTPLHATVNCGHDVIARYLIDHGADLAAVNSDGNLPIDIAESDEMKSLIQDAVISQGIDCDLARKAEERIMTGDAIYWAIESHTLHHAHQMACKVDPETGTAALHVAAAKGYMQVIRLLINCCKVDLNVQDVDGWTPLHAASYWGQKDALELLISLNANTAIKNNKGETYCDLANDDVIDHIKRLEKEPSSRKQARRMYKGPFDYKSSKSRDKDSLSKKEKSCGITCEVARIDEEVALLDKAEKWAADSNKELNIEAGLGDPETGRTPLHVAASKGYMKLMEVLVTRCYVDLDAEDNEGWTPLHFAAFYNQMDAVSDLISWGASHIIKNKKGDTCINVATELMGEQISWLVSKAKGRRRLHSDELELSRKRRELKNKIKAHNASLIKDNDINEYITVENDVDHEPNIKTKPPIPTNSNTESVTVENFNSVDTNSQEKEHAKSDASEYTGSQTDVTPEVPPPSKLHENMISSDDEPKTKSSVENANEKIYTNATGINSSTVQPKLSPGNIFKNFFKSFVPPTRDEESATQRKAHAKRIRETRRSTQGISLEEIQNAEMLIRKNSNPPSSVDSVNTNSTQAADDVSSSASETAPSQKSFALEDAGKTDGEHAKVSNSVGNATEVADTISIRLRRPPIPNDEAVDKSQERVKAHSAKYPDSNIPKNNIRRRSTGITPLNSEPIENRKAVNNEDSVIDYKKLYERSQLEVERLNKIIKSFEEQSSSRGVLEQTASRSSQDVNNEKEKREKRALQRKLSEMEEELRQQKALQTENQRLKDENGALIRVISKLSK